MRQTISMRQALVGAVVVVALCLGGSAAIAGVGPSFTDVPEDHPFADEIEAIAAAGITTGFNDGTYRPGANVTRQAMAAFMGRGFSRVGWGSRSSEIGIGVGTDVASVTVDAGATESGQGYVLLVATGHVVVEDPEEEGPVTAFARIVRSSDGEQGPATLTQLSDTTGTFTLAGDQSESSISAMWAVPLPADSSDTYSFRMGLVGNGNQVLYGTGSIAAIYAPFAASDASTPPTPS